MLKQPARIVIPAFLLFFSFACDFTDTEPGFGYEGTGDDDTLVSGSPTPAPSIVYPGYNPLSMADVILTGELSGDGAGASMAFVGDLNGDGYDDMAIGAPNNDDRQPDAGKVYLFFGGDEWLDEGSLGNATASYQGEGRDDGAGQTVVGAGDLNGDGFDDMLIGAPRNDFGGPDAGRIYVILGKASGWYPGTRLANADYSFYGEEGDMVGDIGTLTAGGDLNKDGYADIAVGAPFNGEGASDAGKVYVLPGSAEGWEKETPLLGSGLEILGDSSDDWLGFSVSIAPDLNGDGFDDLLMGAPHGSIRGTSTGTVYIFFGRPNLSVVKMDVSISENIYTGSDVGEEAGASVAGAGDIDGDGYGDFLIGAWGSTSAWATGKCYVMVGDVELKSGDGTSLTLRDVAAATISGQNYGDYVGRPVAGVGDVDGDGLNDILFGAFLSDFNPGSTVENGGAGFFFFGREAFWRNITTMTQAEHAFYGEKAGDNAGYAVAGGGDLDGDGFAELMIGAFGYDNGGAESVGRAYLYYGGSPYEPFYLGQE